MNVNTFQKHLDKWLRSIHDTQKINDYGAAVRAKQIVKQNKRKKTGEAACEVAMSPHEEIFFLIIIINNRFYHQYYR